MEIRRSRFWLRSPMAVLAVVLAAGAFSALGDDDDDGERAGGESIRHLQPMSPVNERFKAECASCHMLYPPALLPERSWRRMMAELDNHFGENATVDTKVSREITDFLVAHAADRSGGKRASKIARSIPEKEAPLRFSDTAYFRRKHDEIRPEIFKRKKIGSPANCLACHPGAERGNFDEEAVKIPKQ